MSNHQGKPIEGEIVTLAQLDRILGQSQEPDIPVLDALLVRFERLFNQSLKVTDLDAPEGWIGELFGGMDYRIAAKTERGRALYGLIDTFVNNLDQFEKVEQKIRAIHQAQFERHIDRIKAARAALEEQQKLDAVAANARLQGQIEGAKAKAEIARHKADAREQGLRGKPVPPPPPAPKPEDPRVKKKASLQQELDRLAAEEKADLAKISGGKPQDTWTDEMKEEITRTINMYYHAREKVRAELRNFL